MDNTWWGDLIITIEMLIAIFFVLFSDVYFIRELKKKEMEKLKKNNEIAQQIIDFCKETHIFADLKNQLSEITDLSYLQMFEIRLDDNLQDDTPISILLYYCNKTVKKKIVSMLNNTTQHNAIGKVQFQDKQCVNGG